MLTVRQYEWAGFSTLFTSQPLKFLLNVQTLNKTLIPSFYIGWFFINYYYQLFNLGIS